MAKGPLTITITLRDDVREATEHASAELGRTVHDLVTTTIEEVALSWRHGRMDRPQPTLAEVLDRRRAAKRWGP